MIEFQFFEGCPNSTESKKTLELLVNEGFIRKEEIKITEVPDLESAELSKFQGSPTILVDGIDIYSEKQPVSFNYTCRIYTFDGKRTGILSKEFIKMQIVKLRSLK